MNLLKTLKTQITTAKQMA